MSAVNAEPHGMIFPGKTPGGVMAMPSVAPAGTADGGEDFFHRVLDVINPLQHLPVVGTLYRAITGEHIGPVEKIAGDALYGGMWGAIASVADVAFEQITGKSAEDTVLAWFKSDDDAAAGVADARLQPRMAVNVPLPDATLPVLPEAPSSTNGLELAALTRSLSAKGVDSDTAARALYAYRRSQGLALQQVPVVASLN